MDFFSTSRAEGVRIWRIVSRWRPFKRSCNYIRCVGPSGALPKSWRSTERRSGGIYCNTITRLVGTSTVATSTYGYDDDGRLTSLTHATPSTTIAGYTWTYNAANQVATFLNSQRYDEGLSYTDDADGQLLYVTGAGPTDESSVDETYTYNANGSRETADNTNGSNTYSTGANNKMITDGVYTYTYDANGNVLTRTKDGTTIVDTYTWDDRNRLIQVQEADDGVMSWTVKYTYDVNNELEEEKGTSLEEEKEEEKGTSLRRKRRRKRGHH